MNKKETTKIKDFAKQQHICLKCGTCGIKDRGLAVCHLKGNRICSANTCMKIKMEEENE